MDARSTRCWAAWRSSAPRYVCVTGGEPLAQKNCLPLLTGLCDAGYRVSLETSGAMPLADVDPRVIRVVDVKTPGSGEERRNRYDDLALLRAEEQIKFVICDRADYEWSREQVADATAGHTLQRVVLAQRRAIAGAATRRLDSRGPPAGALPAPAAQGALGQCPGKVERMATRAVVLLSGGLDSATVLALAREQGLECYALVGGLRPAPRRRARRRGRGGAQSRRARASRHARAISPTSAARRSPIRSHRRAHDSPAAGIPITYVPARNTIMLSLALAWAEVLDAREIHHRRECRRLFRLSGLPSGVRRRFRAARARLRPGPVWKGASCAIRAPLIHMSKAQIVREGMRLGVDYSLTVSCYQADATGAPAGCVIPVG